VATRLVRQAAAIVKSTRGVGILVGIVVIITILIGKNTIGRIGESKYCLEITKLMSLFDECKQEINCLIDETKILYSKTISLIQRIEESNSFDLEGLGIKAEIEGLNRKLKQLTLRVKYKSEELSMLGQQNIFTEPQANEIRELWTFMLAKMQSTGSLVSDSITRLRDKNFLVDVVYFVEELWTSIEKVIKIATKIVIQGFSVMLIGGTNYLSLPPSDN
jgi:hypothetical protein